MNNTEKITEQIKLRDTLQKFCDEFLPNLECDGCTRFASFLLIAKNIKFEIYLGEIESQTHPNNQFPLHYWIKTKQGILFDFKTKKWIGVESDKTNYQNITKINKKEFLIVGGNPTIVMGILLHEGIIKSNAEKIKEIVRAGH